MVLSRGFLLLLSCYPTRGQRLTSRSFTSSSPEGWMVNFPSAPDTGWPSFSQVMLGSGLPLAAQGKRAWEPSVVDRSGRPVSITGGTVGRGGLLGDGGSARVGCPGSSALGCWRSPLPLPPPLWAASQLCYRPFPTVWTIGGLFESGEAVTV